MLEDSTKQNSPTRIALGNALAIVPVMDEGIDNNEAHKVAIIAKTPNYPQMNSLFFYGFLGTILIGSFNYGSFL